MSAQKRSEKPHTKYVSVWPQEILVAQFSCPVVDKLHPTENSSAAPEKWRTIKNPCQDPSKATAWANCMGERGNSHKRNKSSLKGSWKKKHVPVPSLTTSKIPSHFQIRQWGKETGTAQLSSKPSCFLPDLDYSSSSFSFLEQGWGVWRAFLEFGCCLVLGSCWCAFC